MQNEWDSFAFLAKSETETNVRSERAGSLEIPNIPGIFLPASPIGPNTVQNASSGSDIQIYIAEERSD